MKSISREKRVLLHSTKAFRYTMPGFCIRRNLSLTSGGEHMANVKLSSMPTIRRLPSYLHVIEAALKDGKEYISGTVIAEELELEPIQVRKDLAITGIVG